MPDEGSLKRLGGGRWETRDGRFAIEPQSGTWVVVDSTQTDDLGLPLVRGPFGSLTAAKEAIGSARTAGPAESPLAERIKQARASGTPKRRASGGSKEVRAGRSASQAADEPATVEPEPPAPPPEPKWLTDLAPPDRRRARELIERLHQADVPDAEAIARSEIARDQPALARFAIERSLRAAVGRATSPRAAAQAVLEVLLDGKGNDLDVRWRLVDERGRRIHELDLPD